MWTMNHIAWLLVALLLVPDAAAAASARGGGGSLMLLGTKQHNQKKPHLSLAQTLHRTLAQHGQDAQRAMAQTDAFARLLQGQTAGNQTTQGEQQPANVNDRCISETTVNFDDAFGQDVFGTPYQAQCTCTQYDNSNEVFGTLPFDFSTVNATVEELTAFVDELNLLFGEIEAGSDLTCTSGCDACFEGEGGYCGLLETSEAISFLGRPTNFTLADLDGGLESLDSENVFVDATLDSQTCISFSSGETGRLCINTAFSGVVLISETQVPQSLPTCSIDYNDVPCTSCVADLGANATKICYSADCSNLDPNAVFSTCTGGTPVTSGPFRFLSTYAAIDGTDSILLGECTSGIQPPTAPTVPAVPAPAPVPTAVAPAGATTAAPAAAQLEEPVVADNATATNFPTVVPAAVADSPPTTSPVADAMNTTTTTAPVGTDVETNGNDNETPSSSAPVSAPTPAAAAGSASASFKVAVWQPTGMMVSTSLLLVAAVNGIF